jgi:hypothetical protein
MSGLPIGSAEELALSPEFANGEWRNEQGRTLPQAVIDVLGQQAGAKLWQEAERIFLARHLRASQRGLPLAQTRQHDGSQLPVKLRVISNKGPS